MQSLPTKTWRELQLAVNNLSETSSPRDVLQIIITWAKDNRKLFASEPFSTYGLDKVEKIDESAMPIEFSSFKFSDIASFKNIISNRQAREVEAIARFLRDTVEELVAVEVHKSCPNCKSEGMRVFIGGSNGLLAYQCNVCGHSYYSSGARVDKGCLEFASLKSLKELGVI